MPVRALHVALLCVVPMIGAASLARAEVFKCVDAAGHVTYQETPCAGVERGGPVELLLDNGNPREAPQTEARWREAAAAHEVVPGMPKRWVQQALGLPAQARRGNATDGASEVWIYDTPGAIVRVGFRGNLVAWQRSESRMSAGGSMPGTSADGGTAQPQGGAAGASTSGNAPGPATSDNADALRSRVAQDRNCDEVLAELGAASSRQSLDAEGGALAGAVRYTYEPLPGGLPVRLSFVCVAGRVIAVSRGIPR